MVQYDDWMSESDAVLWHIERDPQLRSTIVSVWLLDTAPDRARMDAVVDRLVAGIPRARQRVVDDQPAVAPPRWEEDPEFDPAAHYTWTRLPEHGDEWRDVLDLAGRIAGQAFDRDRPLWELTVVEGLRNGCAAFVMKVHHAIADGLGMVQILGHMVDTEPDPTGPRDDATGAASHRVPAFFESIPGARTLTHRIATEARTGARIGSASWRTAGNLVRDPVGTVRGLGRMSSSVARIVKPATTPLSPAMTGRSMNGRLESLTIPLGGLRSTAKASGGTVNDAFVAIVLDAFDRYHREVGEPCRQLRMTMPISVRAGDRADEADRVDNQFVPARLELPLDDGAPAERIAAIGARLREIRDEPALHHVNDISGVIGRLGPAAAVSILGGMLKGVDVTASNVPGPPFPMWMAGARIREFYAFGPRAGAAVNITLFSYDGTAHIGLNVDRSAVPDASLLMRCLHDATDDALALEVS